jgi:glycosyltransferase involved in cell wall biosynthesis
MAIIDVPVGWLPEVLPRVRARHTVLRFAFEAFPLPAYLAESIRSVDEVWAMSHYAADIAIASGAKSSSVTVLHPALTAHWQAQLELRVQAARRGELCRRSSAGRTIFSSVFNFEPRKNPEALIRSFLELLTRGHNAHLLVKASGIDTTKFWEWAVGVVGREGTDRLKLACELHCEPLDEPTLSDLISRSDVFVLPTRGEGFGLPFLEAMSVGVPVICPDVGGHRDFCDADNSFLVPTTSVPCALNWDIPLFRESRWREVDYAALVSTLELAATADELVTEKALSAFTRAAAFMQAQGASAHEKTLELCRRLRRHDSGSVAAA